MPHATLTTAAGGPDVLQYRSINVSEPGPGQARIHQRHVGVNFLDVHFRRGERGPDDHPYVGGFEGVGVVEAVGEGVEAATGLRPGVRVGYQLALGAYATERLVAAEKLIPLPNVVSDEAAAALLLKGTTAEYPVRRAHRIRAGETVLVHAASGGVGTLLTQWAAGLGATVIGSVGSEEKAERARRNGVHHAVIHGRESFVDRAMDVTDGRGVDAAYDGVGRATFDGSLASLRPEGTVLLFGSSSGEPDPLELKRLNARSLRVAYPSLGTYTGTRERLLASAESLFEALRRGLVRAEIGQRWPLADARAAHRALEARETVGSTVLDV